MGNDSRVTETIVYLYTYSSDNYLISLGCLSWTAIGSGKIEIQKRPALFRNPQCFVDCSMERSIRYNFFWLIWTAFNISSQMIIIRLYISRAVFPILMVHHFLHTNPHKRSILQRSVTCSFFRELYSHIDKKSGEKVWGYVSRQIASKGTSLKGISEFEKNWKENWKELNQGDNWFWSRGYEINYTQFYNFELKYLVALFWGFNNFANKLMHY